MDRIDCTSRWASTVLAVGKIKPRARSRADLQRPRGGVYGCQSYGYLLSYVVVPGRWATRGTRGSSLRRRTRSTRECTTNFAPLGKRGVRASS